MLFSPFRVTFSFKGHCNSIFQIPLGEVLSRCNVPSKYWLVGVGLKITIEQWICRDQFVSEYLSEVNDEQPKFSQTEYSFSLTENDSEWSTSSNGLRRKPRHYADQLNLLMYVLVQASELIDVVPFNIDSNSGAIRTATALDRKQQSLYVLLATANYQGQPSLSWRVRSLWMSTS